MQILQKAVRPWEEANVPESVYLEFSLGGSSFLISPSALLYLHLPPHTPS